MWISRSDLENMGFMSIGSNCLVDSRAMIYGPEKISLGSNVRVDAFSTVSSQGGRVEIGNHVHIATGVVIYGSGGVSLASGSGLAAGVKILSATDDFMWGNLANPTMPDEFRAVSSAPVVLLEHVLVGVNSVILPGSTIGFGAAVGALTLVKGVVQDHQIVSGNPMRVIGMRNSERMQNRHLEYLKFYGNETSLEQ
jgi:acetyltransferase-like isoleucine patch superfamily enzyme